MSPHTPPQRSDVLPPGLDPTSAGTASPTAPRRLSSLARAVAVVVGLAVIGALLAIALAGLDDEDQQRTTPTSTLLGVTRVSERTLPDGPLPAPTGPVVLTLRDVPRPNVGDDLQLDLAMLDGLGTWSLKVDDRGATGRVATFTGPLLRTVLDAAGFTAADEPRTMNTAALNDYRVDIPVRDARRFPVVLATRTDGELMDVASYGPTRVVYPTKAYDLEPTVYEPRWIWQLKTIDFS